MAKLHPEKISINRTDGGLYREVDVINRLMEALPDDYEIFHSVSWFSVHENTDYHGEIDIIVMGPKGNLILLEVKAGNAVIKDQKLFKVYGNTTKDIERQTRIQFAAIKNRLKSCNLHPHVTNLLVMPDFHISPNTSVAFPRERIIAASDFNSIGSKVEAVMESMTAQSNVTAISQFLNNVFQVSTSLGVIKGQLKQATETLSAGLSDWVPRITTPSKQIHVNATAGSGKSQLAIKLLNAHQDLQTLYVCFNHMLAEHMRTVMEEHATINTYHELCINHYKPISESPDFSDSAIFVNAEKAYAEYITQSQPNYDLIIIDEAQDFKPAWLPSITAQLKSYGMLYVLEDEDQRIYQSDKLPLPNAVTIESDDNFRTPEIICKLINAYGLSTRPINSKSPYQGDLPEIYTYQADDDLVAQTQLALESLMKQGFISKDIVILSAKGHKSSHIKQLEKLGNFQLSKFTGQYNAKGDQIWTEDDIRVDSIYRFKGQSMPAVLLTEIDFKQLDKVAKRLLFVGLTRAEMAVEMVLSKQCAQVIAELS